jgi:hypothetical protein
LSAQRRSTGDATEEGDVAVEVMAGRAQQGGLTAILATWIMTDAKIGDGA